MENLQMPDFRRSNQRFLDSLNGGNMEKLASVSSELTLKKMREDSFASAILPFHDCNDNTLFDRMVNREDLFIILDMESDQFGAKTLSFNNTADQRDFRGDQYVLTFVKHSTPFFTKNVDYLRTYRYDIRQMVIDRAALDLGRQRDVMLINGVNEIVGTPGSTTDDGLQQNICYQGALTKEKHAYLPSLLDDRRIPVGVHLCNKRTASQILTWDPEVIERSKDGITEKITFEGLGAFDKLRIHGVDYVVTIKNDLVPNGVIYQFGTPDFLGKAGVLEQPTMYVEKKEDILTWHAVEKVGMAIGNTAAVNKITFAGLVGSTGGDGRMTSDFPSA